MGDVVFGPLRSLAERSYAVVHHVNADFRVYAFIDRFLAFRNVARY